MDLSPVLPVTGPFFRDIHGCQIQHFQKAVIRRKNRLASVTTSITYDTGYSFSALRSQIENAIKGYLEGLRKEWQDKDALVVRIAQIESRLLAIEGIIDVTDTKLNGTEGNLIISSEKIPVFGGVSE